MGSARGAPLALLLLASWLCSSSSSNWAQLSGSNAQNTVSSDEHPPWTKRWGFASAVIQQVVLTKLGGGGGGSSSAAAAGASPSPKPQLTAPSVLLIMGGEDFTTDATGGMPGVQATAGTTGGGLGGVSNGLAQDFLGVPLLPNAAPIDPTNPATGSGRLHNDVYFTGGASWRVYTDYRQTNAYGEPAPIIASNVSWSATPPWAGFPDRYKASGWKQYLGCCHVTKPFPCDLTRACAVDDNGEEYDDLVSARRWSPRRGAAAAVIVKTTGEDPLVFIMGGRALSLDLTIAPEDGTFQQEDTIHSPTQLMSDVWVSRDAGVTWDFTNAGCWVNSVDSTTFPGLDSQKCKTDDDCVTQKKLGASTFCWFGPLATFSSGSGSGSGGGQGTCVCKHWSPREHHAATVSWLTGTPVLYISGGVSSTSVTRCGDFMCGKNIMKLNTDVWSSGTLGATWNQITSMTVPEDASGRSDHGLIYAAQLMYFLGGRGAAEGDRGSDVFYQSAYTSQVGITWAPATFAPAYGQRAAFSLASDGNAIYMYGGAVPVSAPPPAPALDPVHSVEAASAASAAAQLAAAAGSALPAAAPGSGWSGWAAYAEARRGAAGELVQGLQRTVTNHFFTMYVTDVGLQAAPFAAQRSTWYTDFANPRMPLQASYIHPHWPLAQPLDILNVSARDAAVLAGALGITEAWNLANIAYSSIQLCLDVNQLDIPRICAYKRAAQALVALCTPRFRPWTTWNYDAQVRSARWPLLETASDTSRPDGWTASTPPEDDGCAAAGGPVQSPYAGLTASPGNYVCRSLPAPRRHGALEAMDGRVYVAGGWLAPNTYAADLWYRDDTPPVTKILHAPEDGGGKELALDTTLRLGCSEEVCMYEMRVFKGAGTDPANLVRDWALIPSVYECLPISVPKEATTLQVRAIDPAGNKDPSPLSATWTYIPPIPVGAIVLSVLGALGLLGLGYWLYRRYVRRRLLQEFARRRLARAAAAREREKRKFKKVKRLKKVKVLKQTRPRAFNVFSEEQVDQQNRFKELLGVRASRNRAERIGLAHDPLAAQRLTKVTPPKVGPPPDMGGAAVTRSAKEALGFDAATLSQKTAHELEKQARAFSTLMDSKRGRGEGGAGSSSSSAAVVALPREGAAADFFRTGLQTHADGLAALSKQGVSIERIPANLAMKVARKQARAAGKKEDDAWEISAMSQSLGQQFEQRAAQTKAKPASKSGKKQ